MLIEISQVRSCFFAFCWAFFSAHPSWESAHLMLDGDGSTLNLSHRKIIISSMYRHGFSVRWWRSASSIGEAMLGGWPVEIGGDLTLPNNCMFLQIFVIERSVHFVISAIYDVVNLFLLRIIWIMISCCQDSRFLAILWWVGMLTLPSWVRITYGGCGYI